MQTLTNQQIIEMVPAIGATRPYYEVSDKYSFVPTIEAVDLIRQAGWLPVSAKSCGVRVAVKEGFQKHMIRFSQEQFNGGKEERIDLVLYNSHDRGSAFSLSAAIWRKICSNGLMVASNLFSFKHRHIGFDYKAFMNSAYKIAEGAGQIQNRVNEFKMIQLTNDERLAFAESALPLIYNEPKVNPDILLHERRYDDKGKKDLWTTYNVVQENAMKGKRRYQILDSEGYVRNKTTRAIKSLDKDIKLNKALWTLTEKMAELKKM